MNLVCFTAHGHRQVPPLCSLPDRFSNYYKVGWLLELFHHLLRYVPIDIDNSWKFRCIKIGMFFQKVIRLIVGKDGWMGCTDLKVCKTQRTACWSEKCSNWNNYLSYFANQKNLSTTVLLCHCKLGESIWKFSNTFDWLSFISLQVFIKALLRTYTILWFKATDGNTASQLGWQIFLQCSSDGRCCGNEIFAKLYFACAQVLTY